ncbi:Transferase [Arabidopsis thaliana x Arabidopsis arenosa]|uniref:Transferase n=1 Tax=Arabidopsis thaliana x Arabidopsis arenosa TaxID=1240361 RepID=A0A8T1XHI4_9BRAS|nr:Transferase [Arabidopsis thaliana x Arabidopsis arenosa]
MEAKLEVAEREIIKPSSSAPHDRLQLSLIDVFFPKVYVSAIFFYQTVAGGESPAIISGKLKSSLSETLSRFYPLAGRIEGFSINCNDEGAVFTEARTDLLLSDFLKNNLDDTNNLGEFFPKIEPGESAGTWPLLSVKVCFFGSGSGVAVTVATSHQICDAASLLTFIQSWATVNGESNDMVMTTPHFTGATIYPPPPNSFQANSMDDISGRKGKCVTNRFVFKSSKIADLKRKAASESVPVPTRVEAITSLIWICATNASRSNSSVAAKSTLMSQAMDLRLRIPSNILSRDAIGNLQTGFFLKEGAESEMEIGNMVAKFRKAKEGVNEMIEDNLQEYKTAGAITNTTFGQNLLISVMGNYLSEVKPDVDLYAMTSWCKKPFYKVEFGWGTPVWVGSASHTVYDNTVYAVLMDSKDGEDVEAWVGLPEQDMLMFVRDQDLLTYAVLNPPVLI